MVELNKVTIRDEIGIYRIASGLAKILFPNKQFDKDELKHVIEFTIEIRQKIADLLYRMAPGESENKKIEYKI